MRVTIRSFQEYLETVEPFKGISLFRGQANSAWIMLPKLFRQSNACEIEIEDLKNILATNSPIRQLFNKQHYGASTRLLDLTISPLAALFFALDDISQKESDGKVFILSCESEILVDDPRITDFLKIIANKKLEDIPNNMVEFSFSDHIIKYKTSFALSNERAFLQGGTALICGLSKENGRICRVNSHLCNNHVIGEIIIPHNIKDEIMSELQKLCFTYPVLYSQIGSMGTTSEIILEEVEFQIYQKPEFVKVVAEYKLNHLAFDRSALEKRIKELYKMLFKLYGKNARVFTTIFFNDIDKTNKNWICQTRWTQNLPYIISWNPSYLKYRMNRMNEQVSVEVLIAHISPIVEEAKCLLLDIIKISMLPSYEICKHYIDFSDKSSNLVKGILDTPYSRPEAEKLALDSIGFVHSVDLIIQQMLLLYNRNPKDTSLNYWNLDFIKNSISWVASKTLCKRKMPDNFN